MNLTKRLYIFQKERFPLQILSFTTLSSVLASAAVVGGRPSPLRMAVAFIITTLLLFHVRVIDESRDFKNDAALHPERPVQRGLISLKQLAMVDLVGLSVALILASITNLPALLTVLAFIVFTSLAWRDFFMPQVFEQRPVLYHIINSPQMILVQWLIFCLYTGSYQVSCAMLLLMLLAYNNIFILELVRKTKAPEQDTADTYTAHLGLRQTNRFVGLLFVAGYALLVAVLQSLRPQAWFGCIVGAVVLAGALFVLYRFMHRPGRKRQQLLELAAVLFYVITNLLIYLAYH